MEFTKGMTVRSEVNGCIIVVTGEGKSTSTFKGVAVHGPEIGFEYNDWIADYFHPFDLQSAIEEALKKEKV